MRGLINKKALAGLLLESCLSGWLGSGLLGSGAVLADTDPSRGLSRNTVNGKSDSATAVTPFSNGIYRAIVIGNNQYNDVKGVWKPLRTAISDAESVAAVLKQEYGFADITLMRNATRRQILLAVNDLRSRVKADDSVMIYYAGHGYQDSSTDEAYWIPVDTEGWDDSFFLSNAQIKEKLSTVASKVKHTLIVSDSCFSGTLLRGAGQIKAPAEQNEPFFRKVASKRSVHIMAAGGVEFVDDNFRSSGHSPYTYFFLNELKQNGNELLTSTDLANSLTRNVANNVRQTPQYGVLYGAGDEGGEFIFRRVESKPVSPETKPTLAMNTTNQAAQTVDAFAVELSYWNSVKDMNDPQMLTGYLNKYPKGTFVDIAQRKLQLFGGSKNEIDIIGDVVNSYRRSLEARDSLGVENISEIQAGSKQFLQGLVGQYQSFDVQVTGLKHIKSQHKAKITVNLVNLVNTQGRPVTPGPWGSFEVEVRQNTNGQWKVFW